MNWFRTNAVATLLLAGALSASAQEKTVGIAPTEPHFTVQHDVLIWQMLGRLGNGQAPAQYYGAQGTVVPDSIKLRPIPPGVAQRVPPARGMLYAKVVDEVLIIDPSNHHIIDVVGEQ